MAKSSHQKKGILRPSMTLDESTIPMLFSHAKRSKLYADFGRNDHSILVPTISQET